MTARHGKMLLSESDLMGVDAITGRGHWYAVTNEGDTHDHITHWVARNHMTASYSWVEKSKKMREHISVRLPAKRSLEFRSVVTADGKQATVFSAKLAR